MEIIHYFNRRSKNLLHLNENHLPFPKVKLTIFIQYKITEKTKVVCNSYPYNTYYEHFHSDKAHLTLEQFVQTQIQKI